MSTPALDALDAKAESRRAPVPLATARGRMREALGLPQLDLVDDPARFVWARTARAAGKTASFVSDALDQASSIPGFRGCFGALTKDSGLEQLWDEIRRQDREFGFGLKYDIAEDQIIVPETGGRVRVRSYGTKREVDKWRGKQYHRIWPDECQSVDDAVLRYALISVFPPTLSRHRGSIRLGGTPRMETEGFWFELTGPRGLEPQMYADGSVRALARMFRDRDDPARAALGWAWSGHNWSRADNPGLPHADRESDELRRALAVTQTDREALDVELDGNWPDRDQERRLFRFDPVRNVWIAGRAEHNYGLPTGHEWSFFLGADLAKKRDKFALELGACAPTSKVAYHCDEKIGYRLTIAEMAVEINKFRDLLGRRLVGLVGDSQGPTSNWIFEELCRAHGIPLERAKKGDKDAGVELCSSDFHADRMLIKAGSVLAKQLRDLKKPREDLPASMQPKQEDDAADAWIYTRRRMFHIFGRDQQPPATDEERRMLERRRQLKAMERSEKARRGGWMEGGGGSAPW